MSTELEKYKNAWQLRSQTLVKSNQLTESEIMDFITSQSNSITTSFRRSLLFDICFKAALAVSFLILTYLFKASTNLILLNVVLALFSVTILLLQSKYYRGVPLIENPGNTLKEFLQAKVAYFNREFARAIYLTALSSPMLFLSGSMFYFYFKYGTVRPLDLDDYVVFAAGLSLSFVISAFAQIKQYRFQVEQLEACLSELDEEQINQLTQKKRRNQRVVLVLLFAGIFVTALLATLYILMR